MFALLMREVEMSYIINGLTKRKKMSESLLRDEMKITKPIQEAKTIISKRIVFF